MERLLHSIHTDALLSEKLTGNKREAEEACDSASAATSGPSGSASENPASLAGIACEGATKLGPQLDAARHAQTSIPMFDVTLLRAAFC